jgi:hypothetical protein
VRKPEERITAKLVEKLLVLILAMYLYTTGVK